MLLSAETLWHVKLNQEIYKTQWYISRGHAILKHCAMLNLIKKTYKTQWYISSGHAISIPLPHWQWHKMT